MRDLREETRVAHERREMENVASGGDRAPACMRGVLSERRVDGYTTAANGGKKRGLNGEGKK